MRTTRSTDIEPSTKIEAKVIEINPEGKSPFKIFKSMPNIQVTACPDQNRLGFEIKCEDGAQITHSKQFPTGTLRVALLDCAKTTVTIDGDSDKILLNIPHL